MNYYAQLILLYIIYLNNLTAVEHTNTAGVQGRQSNESNVSNVSNNTTITTTRRPFLQGLPQLKLPCSCADGQCGCCTGVILERFRQKACVNVTYEPDDFSITAKMTMNGRVLYKNTFSGKNPPPICIRPPRFRFIELCVEFSNIYFAQRNIHMCIDAEANWQDFTLLEWSFDCVRLGASGVAVIGEEDGGGLPATVIDGEDQVDEDYDDSARDLPLKKPEAKDIPINATLNKNGDIVFALDPTYTFN